MLARMYDAWVLLSEDPALRVGVVTGAGGTFCSGADLKEMSAGGGERQEWATRIATEADLAWKALLRHYRLKKPLIAAVEGFAVAGGTEILQATDIRVAAETAIFGVTEVTRGLFPLGGSTVRLRRQIPHDAADSC
jgi:enoyl-CoA hydratase